MNGLLRSHKRLLAIIVTTVLMAAVLPIVAAQDVATSVKLLAFNVSYGGRTYDSAANQTTFTYNVNGVDQRPDLSHFDIAIPSCTPALLIVGTSPTDAVSLGVDPTTGVDGIKWDLPLLTSASRTYTITFAGNVAEGAVDVAVKADSVAIGTLPGPSCETASIDVDKFVSVDGATWDDADEIPGPEYQAGDSVSFRFVVSNVGNVDLTNITLADNVYDTSACALPAALAPGDFIECTVGPFPVVDGQHTNVATATGTFNNTLITAADSTHYFSGNLPRVQIDKTISKDGGTTWADSIKIRTGREVFYKLAVTNIGNVALSGLTLSDDSQSTATCALPASIDVDATYECVIGPFLAGEADHTNTATVSAVFEAQTVSDTDTANYRLTDRDTSGVVIIIEGPIEQIDGNIVTIFGVNIEIDPGSTTLNTIRIGDFIRIEGDMEQNGTTIIVIAVTVIIIDIDIVVVGSGPSGPIYVPHGCKITGIGNNNPRLKCSGHSGRSGKSSKKS